MSVRVWIVGPLLLHLVTTGAFAQAPVAVDDAYDVPAGQTAVIDAPGVLGNDTDGAGEDLPASAVADLTDDVTNGVLVLETDGSFTYTPADGFFGTDTFKYRVVDGALVSSKATVTLIVTGCAGTLPILTCWLEADYVTRLHDLGYGTFQEGFEDDAAWALARSPATAPNVTSNGITWSANNETSQLTTGGGPARTGLWGVFVLPHGDASGAPTDPIRDGFEGQRTTALVGVGGWLTSNTGGARVQFILNPTGPSPVVVDFNDPQVIGGHKFFGVIDTRGFTGFEVVETEGVVEDQEFIFADDFTFGASDPPLTATPTSTPSQTPTQTPTHTPNADADILGTITLQGRPSPPDSTWIVPLVLTLTPPEGGAPLFSCTPTSGADGGFSCPGAPTGSHVACVKQAHSLQTCMALSLVSGENTLEFGLLREGDANNDNCVLLVDFSILATSFASCSGAPAFDARADFDGDGCVLLVDFSLLASNFGVCRDEPAQPN